MIIGGACGEAHFQSCDSRDVDQPAMAPNYPLVGVWTAVQPNERGGVSEPSRHRHAPAMMSGSRASAQISARRSKSSRVTRWRRSRSRASIRRKYSARESPWCSALASMVATTWGGTSRIRMSGIGFLPHPWISHAIASSLARRHPHRTRTALYCISIARGPNTRTIRAIDQQTPRTQFAMNA